VFGVGNKGYSDAEVGASVQAVPEYSGKERYRSSIYPLVNWQPVELLA